MLLRIKYIIAKFDLFLAKINLKLPRIFRITKFGLLTTLLSLVIATSISVSYAQEDIPNLGRFVGRENDSGLVPETIFTFSDIVHGRVEEVGDGSGAYLIKGSLLVAANNLVVETYEQQDEVSGVKYIADTLEDAGIVQPVQAQTPGFRSFEPVLKIWKVMRNIALSFVVVMGLIVAVMILLRVRQGQGYVTILNALPKIILSIILIIFSYSIAGLLVDLGNVAEKLVMSVFLRAEFIDDNFYANKIDGASDPDYPYNIYGETPYGTGEESYNKDFNVFRLLSRFTEFETWGSVPCNGRTKPAGYEDIIPDPDMCPLRVTDIIRTPTGIGTLDRGLNIVEKVPAEELLNLIVTIVIITGVVKIFFSLVSSFAKMVIYTMFAPIVFLFVPLSPTVIASWLRYFLSASLLFPAAFLMMFLAAIIMGDPHAPWFTEANGAEIAGIAPNLLTYSTNVSYDGSISYLTRMMAVFIVMMIPTLPQFLMQVLQVTENIMVEGAKQSFKSVFSKVPFVGGMVSGL